jgi:predicted DCC family thiol-disulfide oxidoreductase YuxK
VKSDIRVATPPAKPLMVFDGDCNFCTLWIRRWQHLTPESVDYLPSKDPRVGAQFPEIPRERFASSIQLIEPDGGVYSGAEAVFRTLTKNPKHRWWLSVYEKSSVFAGATEWAYRLVAENRELFSRLTRWLWGRHVEPSNHLLVRWVFLRALGIVYLVAFISLWTQISGLIGHNGILPTDRFMTAVAQQCNTQGIGLERFQVLPTLCWFNSSDSFLQIQCAAGIVLAALLIIGVAPVPCLALLWMLYLSLVTVGRDFLEFQWDNLLLEAGFLAIFFAPSHWLPKLSSNSPPSRLVLWLLRLLLFKLLFMSGCVKLVSGDPNWRNLTALTFHYQTQPLPTWTAWYANLIPLWFQKLSCAGTLAVEVGAPFLIFTPRRLRFLGAAALVGLQIVILLTGNYTFFNWLALSLCLLCLDDFALQKILPRKFVALFKHENPIPVHRWLKAVTIPLAAVVAAISLFQIALLFGAPSKLWFPAAILDAQLAPFRSINSYGLFAVMTTKRQEIIVEGSNDGTTWQAYEFKHKPGPLSRRPDFVAPFQPRLDWQMWFAALGNYQQNPWFDNFCLRLLQGSPEVLALLEKNPFPDKPPRYIRAELYDYHFTNLAEWRATGDWWKRELAGEYLQPISLQK